MVVFLEGSAISTEELWSSVRVTIGLLVSSLTKALLPWLLSLAGRPDLGRVLVVPNFLHLRMMRPLCSWGHSMLQNCFGTVPQICALTQSCLGSSTDNSFNLMACFLLRHVPSTVGPYIDRCVPFQIMSNHVNLPQVDSNQVKETSQGWSM